MIARKRNPGWTFWQPVKRFACNEIQNRDRREPAVRSPAVAEPGYQADTGVEQN